MLETALQGLGAKLCDHLESVNEIKWMHAECSTVWQGLRQIRQVDPSMKNTVSLRFSQTQKSELGREAAPIGPIHFAIMLESPAGGGCGLLNDSERATFRHICQWSSVTGHAPGGQLGRAFSGTRSRTTRMSGFSRLHSLGKSKAKLCDKFAPAQ